MRDFRALPCVLAVVALAAPVVAQTPVPQPGISVSASGKVTARADLAIVFLSTRASSPLAADALDQNNKKVKEVQAKLASMGYREDQIHFSGNRFSPSGQGVYYPGRERPTGFDVYNNLYIYLDGTDLKDIATFNAKVSTLLDELSKIGAGPSNMPISATSMGGASVVAFTVRSPAVYEKQAYQQAMDKAQPIAEDIGQRMKVKITGIEGVTSSSAARAVMGMATPLDEIPYDYLSSSFEEVPIRVSVNVRYSYK